MKAPRRACRYVPLAVCSVVNDVPDVAIHSPGTGAPDLRHASGTSSIVQVDNTKYLPWMIVIAVLAAVGAVGGLAAMFDSANSRHQMRSDLATTEQRLRSDFDLTRREVGEFKARVIDTQQLIQLSGLQKPGDAMTGPGANPQRLKKE